MTYFLDDMYYINSKNTYFLIGSFVVQPPLDSSTVAYKYKARRSDEKGGALAKIAAL